MNVQHASILIFVVVLDDVMRIPRDKRMVSFLPDPTHNFMWELARETNMYMNPPA